jgi:uncharacterized cupin superfamily protein
MASHPDQAGDPARRLGKERIVLRRATGDLHNDPPILMTEHPASTMPAVLSFADTGPEPVRFRPPAERVLAGDPAQEATTVFTSTDGRFTCGEWRAQPGEWRVVFTENEFCHLLEGVIRVVGDDGSDRTFRAGDAFVTPAGFKGTWEILEPARKFFATYE